MRWFAFLCAGLIAASAFGQNLDRERNELKVSGLLDVESANDTLIDLELGAGYLFLDYFEGGVQVSLRDDNAGNRWGLGFFVEQNIPTETSVVPFVGASLGFLHADVAAQTDEEPPIVDENAFVLGLDVGVKSFLTDDLALSFQIGLDLASDDVFAKDDGAEDTNWSLSVGLRYFFDLYYFDFGR